jgi:tetratricopeptide (TPR) repeat protein
MIKIWVIIWLSLTFLLLLYPFGLVLNFIYKFGIKYISQFLSSLREKKMMYKMKEDLIDSNIIEEDIEVSEDEKEISLIQEESISVETIEAIPVFNTTNVVDLLVPNPDKEEGQDSKEDNKKRKKEMEKIVYQALVLRKEWKFDDYEKKIIEWLAIEPDDRDLNKLLADYYFNLWNHKKALSLLKKIVEFDPTDHKAIWQIGEMYLISGDFETAELLVEKAISLNQSNPKYYISMVEILYNTDRKKYAVDVMEKVVKLRPTNTVYLLTLADLCLEIQNFDLAKKNYFRVLEYEPTNDKAKAKLKSLT